MLRDATFKQLRSLSAVIRHGTISAAAEHLHLTPPAVGQQLKLLERAVGLPLFDRRPRGLEPTDAGMAILALADRIEDEIDSSTQAMDLLRLGKIGSVSLGAVSTAKYFAPQMLAAFWRSHPDVEVRLNIGNRAETIAAIAEYQVDITIMGRPPSEIELESIVLGPHPHFIVAPPTHALASATSIGQGELQNERFLVREEGSGTRKLSEWLFINAGIQPRIAMEMTSNESIKQAVMAELGIALISAHTAAVELRDGRMVALDVEELPIMRQWSAVRRHQSHVSPAAQLLWDFLASEAGEHLATLV